MEWINRNDLTKLPKEGYCDVMVNLMTPIGLRTTVMTYFAPSGPDKKFPDDNGFTRNNPQSWDDHFTHYCLIPEPFDGKEKDDLIEKIEKIIIEYTAATITDIVEISLNDIRTLAEEIVKLR